MKTFFKLLTFLAILAFSFTPALLRAQDDGDDQDVSFQTFYDQLADQGDWIQVDNYGYVFQPNVSDPDWAPYTDGAWVDSPAGFYWDSDESWGWATYHYGRWANIQGIGWVWVPGYRWAPAWVSWRYGDDYCGWAPLPPETLYGAEYDDSGVGVDFHFGGDVDVSFGIGPECYNFVRIEDLGGRDYRHTRFHRDRNFEIINHTTNITNLNVHNRGGNRFDRIAAGGPPLNEVNAHSHQQIQTVNFARSNQPGRGARQGNTLSVFAPNVDPGSLHQARPSRVSKTLDHPTFNHGRSITEPLDVSASVKSAPPTPEQIQAAHDAELHAPVTAKVANSHTPITSTLNKPLTSLTPVTHTSNNHGEHHSTGNPGNAPGTPPSTFAPSNQGNNGGEFKPENKPVHTFTPQSQSNDGGVKPENKPVHTFTPQNQNNGDGGFKHEEKPVPTFAPQNQSNDGGAKPEERHTFTPQNQGNDGGAKPEERHTFAPQNQGNDGGAKPEERHTFAPQNQGGGGGGGGNQGGNHSGGQGGGDGGGNHASSNQGGGGGGNHSGGQGQGGGGKPSGDKGDKGGDNKDKNQKP